jgi:very-short-patch-repair endonuclease
MGGKRVPLVQGVNDLATLRPDLLEDWDWDENEVNPDVLQLSSDYYAHWVCHKCGHKWVCRLDSRTKNNHGCPMCSRSKGSSVADYTLYYLLKTSLDCNVFYRYNVFPACEADIYIPSKKLVIEYDGYGFHKFADKQAKDKEKENVFIQNGLTVYRFKERKDRDGDTIFKGNVVSCPEMIMSNFVALKKLLLSAVIKWGILKESDVSKEFINLELNDIRCLVSKPTPGKALSKFLGKDLFWDYEKNGSLVPEEVFAHSRLLNIHIKCKYGHSFETTPRHISDGYGCPFCSGRGAIGRNIKNIKKYYNLSLLLEGFKDETKLLERKYRWVCPFCGLASSSLLRPFSYDKGTSISSGCICTRRYDTYVLTVLGKGLNNKIYYCIELDGRYFLGVAKDTKSDVLLRKVLNENSIIPKLDITLFSKYIGDYLLYEEEYNGYNSIPIDKEKLKAVVGYNVLDCYVGLNNQLLTGYNTSEPLYDIISITKGAVIDYLHRKFKEIGVSLAKNRTVDGLNLSLSDRYFGIKLCVKINSLYNEKVVIDKYIEEKDVVVLTDNLNKVNGYKGCFRIYSVGLEKDICACLDNVILKVLNYYGIEYEYVK